MKTTIFAVFALLLGAGSGAAIAWIQYADPGDQYEHLLGIGEPPAEVDDPTPSHASLVVEGGEEFDFGVMERDQTREHTFTIRNMGTESVKLEISETTCKCAVGELENDTIPPGGLGRVTLEWIAKSYETEFRQSATIKTTSTEHPQIILSVFGRVLHLVQPQPRTIAFSDLPAKESRSADFRLYGFNGSDFQVLESTWEAPETAEYFEFSCEPASEEIVGEMQDADACLLCKVTVKPGLDMGPFEQLLRIKTNVSETGIVEIPIRGRVVSDLSIVGARYNKNSGIVRMGLVSQSEGEKRHRLHVLVKGPHRENVRLAKGEIDPADVLDVEIGEPRILNEGAVYMYPIDLLVRPGEKPISRLDAESQEPGNVTIETTHPDIRRMQLRVSFAVTQEI